MMSKDYLDKWEERQKQNTEIIEQQQTKTKKMSKEELSKVIQIGYDVWNGEYQKLIGWLNTSCPAMGGKKPIEYSKQEIIDEMMRIEYGIYS